MSLKTIIIFNRKYNINYRYVKDISLNICLAKKYCLLLKLEKLK